MMMHDVAVQGGDVFTKIAFKRSVFGHSGGLRPNRGAKKEGGFSVHMLLVMLLCSEDF